MNIGEVKERLREQIEWEKAHPFLSFFKKYRWMRIIHRIMDIPQNIKWKYQRITRGYSDIDVFDAKNFIIEKIQPVLKAYVTHQAERGMSTPVEFSHDPAAWLEVLRKIEYSFDQLYQEEVTYTNEYHEWIMSLMKNDPKAYTDRGNKIQEGLALFGKYLLDLWD